MNLLKFQMVNLWIGSNGVTYSLSDRDDEGSVVRIRKIIQNLQVFYY